MKKKIYIYGNDSDIFKVQKRVHNFNHKHFNNLKEVFIYLSELKKDIIKSNLKMKYYAYDDRLDKDVWMIIADMKGYKNQFISYLIFED